MIPPGASLLSDYVDGATEQQLLAQIDAAPWRDDLKRRVQHYGYLYDYKARRVTASSYLGALPDWLTDLSERFVTEGLFVQPPDQVIVNEYEPGQGIAPHVDCEPCFGDVIASLSLGSGCVMAFRKVTSGEEIGQYLAPRSLLRLRGEARSGWTHGIPARKSDAVDGMTVPRGRRVSLTFRNVVLGG